MTLPLDPDAPLPTPPAAIVRQPVDQGYQAFAPPPGLDLTLTKQQRGALESQKSRAARKKGREEGFEDALENFIPKVIETVQASQELMPKVLAVLTATINGVGEDGKLPKGASEDIKNITPLVKALLDENKRIVDRLIGSSVQRQEQTVNKTVTHVSLSDLLKQRRSDGPPPIDGEVVR